MQVEILPLDNCCVVMYSCEVKEDVKTQVTDWYAPDDERETFFFGRVDGIFIESADSNEKGTMTVHQSLSLCHLLVMFVVCRSARH